MCIISVLVCDVTHHVRDVSVAAFTTFDVKPLFHHNNVCKACMCKAEKVCTEGKYILHNFCVEQHINGK